MPKGLAFYEEFLSKEGPVPGQLQAQIAQDRALGGSTALFAPFLLAENLGTTVYSNLAMPALGAMRLARKGTVASEFGIDPERAVMPDVSSLAGISGMLGQGDVSGLRGVADGDPIRRDVQHGSALSSVIASKADPKAFGEFADSTAGKIALTFADIGVDPTTAIGLVSGAKAAIQGRRLMGAVRSMQKAGRTPGAIGSFLQGQLGREPGLAAQMFGLESAHDYFRPGVIFNRKPLVDLQNVLSGRGLRKAMFDGAVDVAEAMPAEAAAAAPRGRGDISQFLPFEETIPPARTADLAQEAIEAPGQDLLRRLREAQGAIDEPKVADITQEASEALTAAGRPLDEAAEAGIAADAPGQVITDVVSGDELMTEARRIIPRWVKDPQMQEEAIQDVVGDLFTKLSRKPVAEGKNPLNLVRKSMSGQARTWLKRARKRAAEAQTILSGPSSLGKESDSVADLLSSARHSDPAKMASLREEMRINPGKFAEAMDMPDDEVVNAADYMFSAGEASGRTINPKVVKDQLSATPGISDVKFLPDGNVSFKMGDELGVVRVQPRLQRPAGLIRGHEFAGPDAEILGSFRVNVKGVGEIDILAAAKGETLSHELVHMARSAGKITKADWERLVAKFADGITDLRQVEEAVADGLAQSTLSERGIIQKIKEFFNDIYEGLTGQRTAFGAEARFRRGEVFEGTGRLPVPKRADVPSGLAARVAEGQKKISDVISVPKSTVDQAEAIYEGVSPDGYLYSVKRGEKVSKPDWVQDGLDSVSSPEYQRTFDKAYTTLSDAVAAVRRDGWSAVRELWENEIAPKITTGDISIEKNLKSLYQRVAKKNKLWSEMIYGDPSTAWRNMPNKVGRIERIMAGDVPLTIAEGTGVKELYRGDITENILGPVRDLITAKFGKGAKSGIARDMFNMNDTFMVSKRIIGETNELYEESMKLANGSMPNMLKLEKLGDDAVARITKAIGEGDLDKASLIVADEAGNWGRTSTGQGLEWHENYTQWVKDQGYEDAFQKSFDGMKEANQAMLRYAHDKGMINRATLDAFIARGDYYAPLKRVLDESDVVVGDASTRLFSKFIGSQKDVVSPTAQFFEDFHKIIAASDKNEPFKIAGEAIRELGEDAKAIAEIDVFNKSDSSLVKAYIDGEAVGLRFADPSFMNQMNQINKLENPALYKDILKLPSRMLRASVSLDPFFALIRNRIRDIGALPIISRHDSTIGDVFSKATQEDWDKFYRSGGQFGGWMHDAKADFIRKQDTFARQFKGDKNTIVSTFDNFLDAISSTRSRLENLTASSESSTRIVEWKNAYDHAKKMWPNAGEVQWEAFAARESTALLDFNQAGSWIRAINQYVVFLNPGIQGKKKLFEALGRNPGKFAKNIGIYSALPSIGSYLMAKTLGRGDEYVELPAYRRDYFWNIPAPYGGWISVPKSFESGVIGTTAERMIDWASGNPKAFDGHINSLIESISPMSRQDFAGPFRPFFEVAANKDLFRDAYIIPPYEEGKALALREGAKRTGRLGQTMAWMLGGVTGADDPRQWEHLIQSMLGGYGRAAVKLSKIGVPEADLGVRDILGLTGVIRKDSPYSNISVQNVLTRQRELGLERDAGSKRISKLLRSATRGKVSPERLMDAINKREMELEKISIKDILSKRQRSRR